MTDEQTLYGLLALAEKNQETATAAMAELRAGVAALNAGTRAFAAVPGQVPEAVKAGVAAGLVQASGEAAQKIAAPVSQAARDAHSAAESVRSALRWLNWTAMFAAFVLGFALALGLMVWGEYPRLDRIEAFAAATWQQTPRAHPEAASAHDAKKPARR